MRLPSWEEFLEKEKIWENQIHQRLKEKVSGTVKDHPFLDMAFSASLALLPPPFGTIAQSVYDNAKGSGNDPLNAVLKYFNELEEKGQEHYEIVANKLDSALIGIQDLKDIGNKISEIQEILIEEVRNVDAKIDDIKRAQKDDHSAIMQPRWEKEKNAFAIGEGLMSLFNNKKRWLTEDMFFDLCANVGFVNLNKEEASIIFDPNVDPMSKPTLIDNFRKKADLNLDRDLGCALNIGANYALLRDALNEAVEKNIQPANIQPVILRPYQSLLERKKGLTEGGAVYKTAECLAKILKPYVDSNNELQNVKELLEKVYDCAKRNILG